MNSSNKKTYSCLPMTRCHWSTDWWQTTKMLLDFGNYLDIFNYKYKFKIHWLTCIYLCFEHETVYENVLYDWSTGIKIFITYSSTLLLYRVMQTTITRLKTTVQKLIKVKNEMQPQQIYIYNISPTTDSRKLFQLCEKTQNGTFEGVGICFGKFHMWFWDHYNHKISLAKMTQDKIRKRTLPDIKPKDSSIPESVWHLMSSVNVCLFILINWNL